MKKDEFITQELGLTIETDCVIGEIISSDVDLIADAIYKMDRGVGSIQALGGIGASLNLVLNEDDDFLTDLNNASERTISILYGYSKILDIDLLNKLKDQYDVEWYLTDATFNDLDALGETNVFDNVFNKMVELRDFDNNPRLYKYLVDYRSDNIPDDITIERYKLYRGEEITYIYHDDFDHVVQYSLSADPSVSNTNKTTFNNITKLWLKTNKAERLI